MITYDGHIHTPFCPHGSTDKLSAYVENAIKLGFTGMTFTEHAPLPENFLDPAPEMDSCMNQEDFESYILDVKSIKEFYKNKINIHTGLEVDYIIGYEKETKELLDQYGPHLDDGIISVHFLKKDETYFCMDYSAENFMEIVTSFGGLDLVYDRYFETVKKSILADLGTYKPNRIGHITLVNKFQKCFKEIPPYSGHIYHLLDLIKEKNYTLDYNGAGTVKPDCLEPYPPNWVVMEAQKRNIPLVYGSDAHTAKGIGQGIDQLLKNISFSAPLCSDH